MMPVRIYFCISVLTALILALDASSADQTEPAPETDTELIEALIAHHEASSNAIANYSAEYTYSMEYGQNVPDEEHQSDTTAQAKIIRSGDSYWCWRHSISDTPNIIGSEIIETAVLNAQYFAHASIPVKANNSYELLNLIEHRGFHNLNQPPILRMAPSFPAPEPIHFAFSKGRGGLREFYERNPEHCKWTVQVDEETDTYILQRQLITDAPTRSTRKYWISPTRNYLIKRMELWNSHDALEDSYTCTFMQIDGKIWFPNNIIYRRKSNNLICTMTVQKASIYPSFADSQFTFEKLPIDFHKTVLRKHSLKGTTNDYIYIDGQYVPESSLQRK